MNKVIFDDEAHRKRREIMRRYRITHHKKVLEINKKSRSRNREKIRAGKRRYAQAHPLASVHHGMMKRCGHRKGKSPHWEHYYSGRGIIVCQEWHSFPVFEKWALANGYQKGLQIDRIDPNGNYCPENCRFVSPHDNAVNRRSSFCVEWNGEVVPLMKVYEAAKCPLPYDLVRNRVRRNKWPVERALTEPAKERA